MRCLINWGLEVGEIVIVVEKVRRQWNCGRRLRIVCLERRT